MPFDSIDKLTASHSGSAYNLFAKLQSSGEIASIIEKRNLMVRMQSEDGILLASISDYGKKFPMLAAAGQKLLTGEKLGRLQRNALRGYLHNWSAYVFGSKDPVTRNLNRMRGVTRELLISGYQALLNSGVKPFFPLYESFIGFAILSPTAKLAHSLSKSSTE